MTSAGKGIISFMFPDPGSPELPTVGTTRRLQRATVVPCGDLLPAGS